MRRPFIGGNWKCNGSNEMMVSWCAAYDRELDGNDTYVFISYSGASGSSTLWNASDREDLLEKSHPVLNLA